MSTLSPVADPTASMPPVADLPDVELPDALRVATMTDPMSVPDPTAADFMDDLDDTDLPDPESMVNVAPSSLDPENKLPTKSAPAGSSSSKRKKATQHPPMVEMATAATALQANGQSNQGENTGRWTAEEHRLFLQGLEIHGKGWKKIAGLIKSRTVVQIRTHAQKYFQKLAKAKQNGEEGEVMMEGRGVPVSVAAAMPANSSGATAAQAKIRRKHPATGTKRKAISSVVASSQRQAKKHANGNGPVGVAIAPALAPYVFPAPASAADGAVPSTTTAQGTISGPALEDSLFRFLTPVPVARSEPQVNEVARQAGANPISLPREKQTVLAGGEISPTGVTELSLTSWADPSKDTPSWYTKGSDVDALFDVADTLDWLADSGDLNENYDYVDIDTTATTPAPVYTAPAMTPHGGPAPGAGVAYPSTTSMNTLPRIESGAQVVVPPLPSLFDGAPTDDSAGVPDMDSAEPSRKLVLHNLNSTSVTDLDNDDRLQVFGTHDEEEEFVSTILDHDDTTGDSSTSLSALGVAATM